MSNPALLYLAPNETNPTRQNSVTRQLVEIGNYFLQSTVTPEQFGAKGDGVTDDSTAINAAIAFVGFFGTGGGQVVFGPKTYAVASTIKVNNSNIQLVGSGADQLHKDVATQFYCTKILWVGATSSTTAVVKVFTDTTVQSSVHIVNSGIRGIQIDANSKAGYGVEILSVVGGEFANVTVANATSRAWYLHCLRTTTDLSDDFGDNQQNRFIRCNFDLTTNADGWFLDGDQVAFTANTSFNHWADCKGNTTGTGNGFVLVYTDNNTFHNCSSFMNGGNDFDIHGVNSGGVINVCNSFIQCSWGKFLIRGTNSGYTQGSTDNWIVTYDLANGSPYPTLESKALFIAPVTGGFNGITAGTAPPTWTPVITSFSGTLTTVTSTQQYRHTGKTIFFGIKITVTNKGTGAGALEVTLPPLNFTLSSGLWAPGLNAFSGINTTQGFALIAQPTSNTSMQVTDINGNFPVTANNDVLNISGWYIID